MANWKPGDQALILVSSPGRDAAGVHGVTCTLLVYRGNARTVYTGSIIHRAWQVQCSDRFGIAYVDEHCLYPIDGESASWERVREICGWEPAEVVHEHSVSEA